jgi:hypothetical protein
MATDFIPAREADLVTWSANFSTRISATPTAFGLTAGQATAYATLNTAWATAFTAASNDATRTPSAIITKNDARDALVANARMLAKIVQGYPAITNTQRSDLGLTVPTDEPTPINPPTEPPVLEVVSVIGRTMKIRLSAVGSERRGKPEGVSGATVLSFVGSTPPVAIGDWKFEGSITRTTFDVEFPTSVPAAAQVWLCAFWFNPRSQSGPACTPVSAYIAPGVSVAA